MEVWENCYDAHERIRYFRKHSYTAESYLALIKAIRGDWGEAANMLHSPSDFIG
jgi:hypothetical protein